MAICRVIQKWNVEVNYNILTANCQKFAAEVLESVGLDNRFVEMEGPIGDFLVTFLHHFFGFFWFWNQTFSIAEISLSCQGERSPLHSLQRRASQKVGNSH